MVAYHGLHKNIKQHCFHQISILEWFVKDNMTNDAENSALHYRNKYIQIHNSSFK